MLPTGCRVAGKRAGLGQPQVWKRDFAEPLRKLILLCSTIRTILISPKKSLLPNEQHEDLAQIVAQLRGAGYAVSWRSLDARRCVPQKRLRVYIAPRTIRGEVQSLHP